MDVAGRLRDLRHGTTLRAHRALPRRMSTAVRAIVAMGYVVVTCLGIVLITGWRGPAQQVLGQQLLPATHWLTMVALGVLAVVVTIAAVRSAGPTRLLLSVVALVVVALVLDALPTGPTRLGLVAVGLVAAIVALTLPMTTSHRELTRIGLAALPLAAVLATAGLANDVDLALTALRDAQLAPTATVALPLLALFSMSSTVEGYRERADRLMTWRVTEPAVIGVAAVKLALLCALYANLLGGFVGGQQFWRLRLDQPLSWLHALVVGLLVVGIGMRSERSPVRGHGFTTRLAILVALLGVSELVAAVALVILVVVSTVSPGSGTSAFFAAPNWVVDHSTVLQLAAVVVLLAGALTETALRRRLTTGRYLWIVAGVWLLPPLFGIAVIADNSTVTAWAAPGQVDTVMTALVVGLWVAGRRRIPPRRLLALLVVPSVVLHLGQLWPSEWMDRVLSVGLVGAAAVALVLAAPPVSGDTRQVERERAGSLATQLAILVGYLYLLPAGLDASVSASATLAWLWLGVPVLAVLSVRIARPVELS